MESGLISGFLSYITEKSSELPCDTRTLRGDAHADAEETAA